MNLVDLVIVLLLAISAFAGFRSGLVQCVASLIGLIAGVAIASWQYKRFPLDLAIMLHSQAMADAIWFCLVVLLVMIIASLAGVIVKRMIHGFGLGGLDRAFGLVFGILRGALLATLCIVVVAAFFPETKWLGEAQLSRYFLSTAHLTTKITPKDLKAKIQNGLHVLEQDSPDWLHPK